MAPPAGPRSLPVPRHRIGPVVQSLLLMARESGSIELARRLADLVRVLDRDREPGPAEPRRSDALWWAAHLLGEVLLRVPDAMPYWGVLRLLAQRITARSIERGGFQDGSASGGLGRFGPWFWLRLAVPLPDRLDLLRLLLPADPPPNGPAGPRFLTTVAELVGDRPRVAMPAVCGWFDDERPLQAPVQGPLHSPAQAPAVTVAAAAQALLHTHRQRAVDDLTEALVAAAHPRADELLAALAEDEPSAVCRAVDRWAHEKRPERHVAAISYGLRAAPHVTSAADRELLRYAALAVLARPADCTLHGGALGLLVRDPVTRSRHLPDALRHFAAGDPQLPVSALVTALPAHPEPVFAAVQARLREPGEGAGEVLRELAEVTTPALARRVAVLVRDHLEHRPEGAAHVAAYLDRRLEHGPAARSVLFPLAIGLLREHPPEVRRALAPVLAAPGTHTSRPLRQELLDDLLDHERDPGVLDTLLQAAADGCARRPAPMTRDLVHRIGLLLGRTAEGAASFDLRLVQLASGTPGFARQVRGWLAAPGGGWDAVIGPSARRMFEQPDPGPPAALAL